MIPFDPIARVAAQVIRSRDLQGKVFLSDLDRETASLNMIAKDVKTMTVFANFYDAGGSAVQAAVMLAGKKSPPVNKMVDFGAGEVPTYIPLPAVTRKNVCEVIKGAPQVWILISAAFENPDDCKQPAELKPASISAVPLQIESRLARHLACARPTPARASEYETTFQAAVSWRKGLIICGLTVRWRW